MSDFRRGVRAVRPPRLRAGLDSSLLSAPALLFVLLVFIGPMLAMALYSFWPSTDSGQIVHEFTTSNYTRFFEQHAYWHTLLTSAWLAGIAALLTVILTLPFAYFVANKVRPSHRIAWILVAIMPFWT